MANDDEELFAGVKVAINKLGINDKCNSKVLSKFAECNILY